jgi:hypothetical protein
MLWLVRGVLVIATREHNKYATRKHSHEIGQLDSKLPSALRATKLL